VDASQARDQQRLLRRSRIRHVLAVDDDLATQAARRDRLMGPLATAASRPQVEFGTAGEDLIDLAVAVSLVDAPEPPADSVSAMALTMMILAADGQFARLRALNGRLGELAEQLDAARPFLGATLQTLADVTAGRFTPARARLAGALGGRGDQIQARPPRTDEQLSDVLLTAATRDWLTGEGLGLAREARDLAIGRGDGALLALTDLLITLGTAVDTASLHDALGRAGLDMTARTWQRYLATTDIPTLFPAQLRALDSGVLGGTTRVVALPTSSGKTHIAELRMAADLARNPGGRALYVAPYRLLARQVERRLRQGLRAFGITVADLGNAFDTTLGPFLAGEEPDNVASESRPPRDEAEAAGLPDVGICTPERLDGLLRLSTTSRPGATAAAAMFRSLRLLVFDELQLIGRPGRGPRLELLLTRLRAQFPGLPVLGLSAASMGAEDLAAWLGDPAPVTGGRRPTGTVETLWQTNGALVQRFGRDVKRVADIPRSASAVQDAATLAARVPLEYAPVLIVETTRPLAENVAGRILRTATGTAATWRATLTEPQRIALANVAEEVTATLGDGHSLAKLLPEGIAYHHAGVPQHLLRGIERLAADRALRFLIATTTVAEGADLPFRVAIIPHLSFQGITGRIERDLYLNLVGRAGRAGVAFVILLDSDARSLRNHVRASLWSDTQADRVQGLLGRLGIAGQSVESAGVLRDVLQQLLAWLGESGDGKEDQAYALAAQTFTWVTGSHQQQGQVVATIDQMFRYLEGQGLIVAGSPYRLTESGARARLAGMSVRSCLRLATRVTGPSRQLLAGIEEAAKLNPDECHALARLAFDTVEVVEQGLWLRRTYRDDKSRTAAVFGLENATIDWPDHDEIFQADVALLASWLGGSSFTDLGALAPVFSKGIFSKDSPADRASDAAELLGRLSYPASWAMNAIRALASDLTLPGWLSAAVQLGVPSQTSAALISERGLSRGGALLLASELPPRWNDAKPALDDISEAAAREIGLTRADAARLAASR
jgi:hypothetical protein